MWPVLRRHRRAAIALVALAPFVLIVVVINTIAGHGSSPQSAQVELPFTGLHDPWRVAVDTDGNVYVADDANRRVLKLPAR